MFQNPIIQTLIIVTEMRAKESYVHSLLSSSVEPETGTRYERGRLQFKIKSHFLETFSYYNVKVGVSGK